jgi:sugar phosphate isomerase/epimerase
MRTVIEAMEIFEPVYLNIHPSGGKTDYEYSAVKDNLVASFNSLIPAATQIGTVLCMENLGNAASRSTSLTMQPEYINAIVAACPGLKVCLDTSHAYVKTADNGRQADVALFIKALGENIATVHLHDADGSNDYHLYPGYSGLFEIEGTMDWGAIYSALVGECKYRGPFNYEMATYAPDCICNFSNLAHNYYNYVYPEYIKYFGVTLQENDR